nr:hypothetical protein CFP56_71245 [Quercus suber]
MGLTYDGVRLVGRKARNSGELGLQCRVARRAMDHRRWIRGRACLGWSDNDQSTHLFAQQQSLGPLESKKEAAPATHLRHGVSVLCGGGTHAGRLFLRRDPDSCGHDAENTHRDRRTSDRRDDSEKTDSLLPSLWLLLDGNDNASTNSQRTGTSTYHLFPKETVTSMASVCVAAWTAMRNLGSSHFSIDAHSRTFVSHHTGRGRVGVVCPTLCSWNRVEVTTDYRHADEIDTQQRWFGAVCSHVCVYTTHLGHTYVYAVRRWDDTEGKMLERMAL